MRRLIRDQTFGGDLQTESHAVEVFERHYAEVRRVIPTSRLIEYSVGDGWEPLCSALGVAVPAEDFPQVNSREDFRSFAKLGA